VQRGGEETGARVDILHVPVARQMQERHTHHTDTMRTPFQPCAFHTRTCRFDGESRWGFYVFLRLDVFLPGLRVRVSHVGVGVGVGVDVDVDVDMDAP